MDHETSGIDAEDLGRMNPWREDDAYLRPPRNQDRMQPGFQQRNMTDDK
jgi:hypothetical protein